MKTLALPILIQSLTVLPNHEWVIKEIQDIFYNFLWNGKNDKIKRTVRERPFNLNGIFLKKNILIPNVAENKILILVEEKKLI
jgi:hypothetical protein